MQTFTNKNTLALPAGSTPSRRDNQSKHSLKLTQLGRWPTTAERMLSPETNALKMSFLSHHRSYHTVFLWLVLNNQKIESPGNEDQSIRPEQLNEDPRSVRCGRYLYNKRTQKCCYNRVIPRYSSCVVYRRCGLRSYNPLTHSCCGGRYLYNKKTQKCCYNRVIPRYSSCVVYRRCGLRSYNPLTHSCCGGRYLYNKRTQKCCYGRVISFYSTCRFYG